MDRSLLLLLTTFWAFTAFAQKETPADSLVTPHTPTVADLTANLPQATPKSPTAAALSRYGEYPVSLYTGLPTIEIPIYSFRVGGYEVPVKLTYHAAGQRVSELPSWVGLGWSLQTGGLVTRTMLSRPDEGAGGLLAQAVSDPNSFYSQSCLTQTTHQQMQDLVNNTTDNQRDVFSWQLPTGGNSFIIQPTAPGYVLLRSEPVRVSVGASLTSVSLTLTDGTLCRFNDREVTATNATGPNPISAYTSAWHLSELISATNEERAVYTYSSPISVNSAPEPQDTWVVQGELNETQAGTSGVQTGITNRTSSDSRQTVATLYPAQIDFPGGRLVFSRSNQTTADGVPILTTIDLLGYDITTESYTRIRQYKLLRGNQDGTTNATGDFLTGVQWLAADATTVLGSYGLTYNTQYTRPAKTSRAKDYWGYYNGQTGSTLIPTQTFSVVLNTNSGNGPTTLAIGDANRDPDPARMKAGMLKRISYPTGGYTDFSFEANQYYNTNNTLTTAGGLRITQLDHYTATGQFASRKRYVYGAGETGAGTLRSLFIASLLGSQTKTLYASQQLHYDVPFASPTPTYEYKTFTFTSAPTLPLTPDEGSPVTYPVVTEYQENAAGVATGKTVYQFRDAAADGFIQVGGGRNFFTSRAWDRGQSVLTEQYDTGGNLRRRVAIEYGQFGTGQSTDAAGVLVTSTVQQIGNISYNGSGCMTPPFVYLVGPRYNYSYGLTLPISTSTYQYADDNSGRFTLRVDQTDYDAGFYQPRETRAFVEGGAVVGSEYHYPQDYGPIAANAGSTELLGMLALQNRNSYRPIEEVQFRRETTTATKEYKTGRLTSFTAITLNSVGTALPYKTYLLESVPGTFTAIGYQSSPARYTASGNNGSLFPLDPRYALRLTMTSYDSYGNLTRYDVAAGSATSFGYNRYTPGGGVAFSTLYQQTLNAGQSNTLTTTYGYTRPVLGLSSMTSPRGVATYYSYDSFGRLQTITDKDGYVLKQYTYGYTTQP
jgi:YD repeat-containing protein